MGHAGATCTVRAFGLPEYSSLPARSVLRDESSGERSGRGSVLLKAGSDAQGAQGRCVLDVRETLHNAAYQVPLSQKQVLVRKAPGGDVRGAGLWPTGVHEPLQNAAPEVPSF